MAIYVSFDKKALTFSTNSDIYIYQPFDNLIRICQLRFAIVDQISTVA